MNKENLKFVFFYPWVGKNYEKGINGKKILILGESHICGGCQGQCGNLQIEDHTCRHMTDNVIMELISYKKGEGIKHKRWMNTLTKFSNVFANKHLTTEEFVGFMDSILFYNYVQYSTDEARISPTEEEFECSKKAFFEVLTEYKPDLIIAFGDRLWRKLPHGGEYEKPKDFTLINDGKGLYYYTINNKKIPIMYIYHPSSSHFSYSTHDIIREALIKIR